MLIAAGAVAIASGSVTFAAPAAADCPSGTVQSRFPGVCVSGPSGRGGQIPVINPSDVTTNIQPNQIPTMNGVPCNWQHWVTCFGMSQNQ